MFKKSIDNTEHSEKQEAVSLATNSEKQEQLEEEIGKESLRKKYSKLEELKKEYEEQLEEYKETNSKENENKLKELKEQLNLLLEELNNDIYIYKWDKYDRYYLPKETKIKENYHVVDTLEGHDDSINTLQVLPDGIIVSGSDDGTIKIWCDDEKDESNN